MPLPSSGAISLSQVNTELGLSSTATISMNDSAVRSLFGKAGSGSSISMSDGYGKANQFTFTISSAQSGANLRTLAINAGWNQSSRVVATINSGVVISSSSTGTPALTINGSFPGGVQLINNGTIVGRGGNGGNGGGYPTYTNLYGGFPGGAGGVGLSVSVGVSITNNGIIGGGGGGGGGGAMDTVSCVGDYPGGGGGGGGGFGSGGLGGTMFGGNPVGAAGSAGGVNSGGAGGQGAGSGLGATGGSGGFSGANGGGGAGGPRIGSSSSAGGGGGAAVSGNANISWSATGTRYGAIA